MQGEQTFHIKKMSNSTFLMFIFLIFIMFGWGQEVNRTGIYRNLLRTEILILILILLCN